MTPLPPLTNSYAILTLNMRHSYTGRSLLYPEVAMNDTQTRPTVPILESRLDWLTATVKPGNKQQVVKGRVESWMARREADGYPRHKFVTPFYQGERVNGIAIGLREDDAMITLSGPQASEHGAMVITWADTVSRLDAQITVQEPDLSKDWAGYVDAVAGQSNLVKSKAIKTRLIRQRPNGVTSYIGSPGADRMLRCYDKHAESDGDYPPGAWRFEVQWRHNRATNAAYALLNRGISPLSCLESICSAYLSYGVSLPVHCLPPGWRDANIRSRTDNQRRLDWLHTSIAPVVGKLIDAEGVDTVLGALGLQFIVDTLDVQASMLRAIDVVPILRPGADLITSNTEGAQA